ncbi:MAG: hypothetical protein MK193_12010 [Lentisphaeria bacterium]|nr:hypothetical protein [Lentisphaeria bacterium]
MMKTMIIFAAVLFAAVPVTYAGGKCCPSKEAKAETPKTEDATTATDKDAKKEVKEEAKK